MKKLQNTLICLISIVVLLLTPMTRAEAEELQTSITGISGPALNNAQERLAIILQGYHTPFTEKQIHAFFRAAPQEIKHAIEPYGYFKATIESQLSQKGDIWTARFILHRGPRLHIAHLEVNITGPGQDNTALKRLLMKFPLQPGQVLETEKYETAKKSLFQVANNQGYIKAVLEKKEIRIDLKKYTADVILSLDTGPRYYFGAIKFDQTTFSPEFLNRFLPFQEGEPFSSQKLLLLQQNLSNSHYFQQVSIFPNIEQPNGYQVPVDVGLKATKSQKYDVGFGYGTYTGPRLTLGANLRHVTDTGHYVKMQMKVSPILQGLAAQYVIPGHNPLTDAYTLGVNVERFLPKNGHSISKNLSFSYTTLWQGWKTTPTLTYLRENYFIEGQPSSHNSRLFIPSLALTRIKADDLIIPRSGHKIDFVIRGASTQMISNTNFVQTEVKGKYIFSPTPVSTVVLSGDFGYTVVENIRSLPLTLQFFAGGMNSVRGFPYTYFGPGRYLKTGSVEYRHHIIDKWSGAVFYDLGMADDHINAPMGHGIGIGAIYDSVVGPVRLYTGFGKLKDKPRHFDFEFSIGPEL